MGSFFVSRTSLYAVDFHDLLAVLVENLLAVLVEDSHLVVLLVELLDHAVLVDYLAEEVDLLGLVHPLPVLVD